MFVIWAITPFATNAFGPSITRKDEKFEILPTLSVYEDEKDFISLLVHENWLIRNRDRGFKYIDDIVESILYYTENSDAYLTFEDYYPEVIKVFEELSSNK